MVLGKVKNLTINFDCLNDSNVPVYSSGDTVSGRVNLEVTGEIRVKSLKIHARGHAKVRWTESRNAGSNTAYTQNYTEEVEYFNHKDILIGHERGEWCTGLQTRWLAVCWRFAKLRGWGPGPEAVMHAGICRDCKRRFPVAPVPARSVPRALEPHWHLAR